MCAWWWVVDEVGVMVCVGVSVCVCVYGDGWLMMWVSWPVWV